MARRSAERRRASVRLRNEAVRSLYATGNFTMSQLARKFHVNRVTIWRILRGEIEPII